MAWFIARSPYLAPGYRVVIAEDYLLRAQPLHLSAICVKKSLPLSSTRMKAGKSYTSIFQMASMPNSGYSRSSTFLMEF